MKGRTFAEIDEHENHTSSIETDHNCRSNLALKLILSGSYLTLTHVHLIPRCFRQSPRFPQI